MNSIPTATPKQHVTSLPDVCGGKPCVAGTRVRVWDVATHAQSGESPDDILAHFPHLSLADIHAALAYYYDNREAIDQQSADEDRFAQEFHQVAGPGPLEKKLSDGLHRREPTSGA